jgi:hypothetical protein
MIKHCVEFCWKSMNYKMLMLILGENFSQTEDEYVYEFRWKLLKL